MRYPLTSFLFFAVSRRVLVPGMKPPSSRACVPGSHPLAPSQKSGYPGCVAVWKSEFMRRFFGASSAAAANTPDTASRARHVLSFLIAIVASLFYVQ